MLAALDPHSSYAEATDFDPLKTTTDGNYGGLGLTVAIEDGAVKVISPTEDTPAWRAGIKSGDYITHIDGELLYGLIARRGGREDARRARAPAIKLTIVRPGRDKPFDVSMIRERIELRPVKWEVKDGIGIININCFAGNTGDATKAALMAIDKATGGKPLGYVVDLRSNPGGLLDQAIDVSDAFLERGEIVSQRGREKDDIERYYAEPGRHGARPAGHRAGRRRAAPRRPRSSPARCRIIAARCVMGERSFGKGSVQTVSRPGPKAALRLTTARYYTPSGRSVQAGGIDPDIAVPQLTRRRTTRTARSSAKPTFAATCSARPTSTTRCSRTTITPDPRFNFDRGGAREEGRQGLPARLCAADAEAAGHARHERRCGEHAKKS